jgi:2,3-bisphosphoglycerate-dependent phosphoglycerate mutase
MIRHGESIWNKENRFTGWCDVPLTENGEMDARDAGSLLHEREMKFDVAFTSDLERAWRTCAIVLSAANQSGAEVIRSWRLNERHYGGMSTI